MQIYVVFTVLNMLFVSENYLKNFKLPPKNVQNFTFLKSCIFWQICNNESEVSKSRQRQNCMKRKDFNHSFMFSNENHLWNFWPPLRLPQCSTSAWCYLDTQITTPPFGHFLLLICSRHARSTKIPISAFQKPPTKNSKSKKECWNSKCMNNNAAVCKEFEDRSRFPDKTRLCLKDAATSRLRVGVFTFTLMTWWWTN